jgi:hypothetical protein
MKKIILFILLILATVISFAQPRNAITFAVGGGGAGAQLFISPEKLKGFGFFLDSRFDVYKDFNREDGISKVTGVYQQNTWQTDYGSYTTVTKTFSEMPYKNIGTVHNIINCGISFPIKNNQLSGYAGVGVIRTRYEVENYIQKVIETSEFTHYEALGFNTTDNDIWSFDKTLQEEKIIKNSLNLTGGIIWNIEGFGSITTGMDLNFKENGGLAKPNIVVGMGWYFSRNGLMR